MMLGKMKEYAEAFVGTEITDAVITVPACLSFISTVHMKLLTCCSLPFRLHRWAETSNKRRWPNRRSKRSPNRE